jgi:uncharacterized membrane protein YdjX (TVP38/TMEM64 family)
MKVCTWQDSLILPLLLLLLMGCLIGAARYIRLEHYLEKEFLRQLLAAYGMWGPVVYLCIWLLANGMFMPVTPLVLAGGVLFGPGWGEIYVLIGAIAGAVLAFLSACYLARDCGAGKIFRTKLATLDEKLTRHVCKIVALSRVIPYLPFSPGGISIKFRGGNFLRDVST